MCIPHAGIHIASMCQTLLRLSPRTHTETFSCVFVLFTVLKGIENNQAHYLKQYTKTQENVSVCTRGLNSSPFAGSHNPMQLFA